MCGAPLLTINNIFKDSFASINKLNTETPVDNFVNTNDKEALTKDNKEDKTECCGGNILFWSILGCLGAVAVVGALVGIIYGVVSATDSSDDFVSALVKGPGDNCKIIF